MSTLRETKLQVWPSSRQQVPPSLARPVTLRAGGLLVVDTAIDPVDVDLPEELLFRELSDLDLSSEDEIADFCSRYGQLTARPLLAATFEIDLRLFGIDAYEPGSELRELYGEIDDVLEALALQQAGLEQLIESVEKTGELDPSIAGVEQESEGLRARAHQLRVLLADLGAHAQSSPREPVILHVESFRLLARQLRDMARTWRGLCGVIDEAEVLEAWESEHWPRPRDFAQAVSETFERLNEALVPFAPRVQLVPDVPEVGLVRPRTFSGVGLYNLLCFQLLNEVIESPTYRFCKKCGRAFVRHRGRSRGGRWQEQYRATGVEYCSTDCAQASASSTYGKRQSIVGELARQGLTPEQIACEIKEPVQTVRRRLEAYERRSAARRKPKQDVSEG